MIDQYIPSATDTAARAELDIRREGRWMLGAGSATAGLSVTAALSYRTWAGKPFPYEIAMTLFGCAIILILTGLHERAERRYRTALRNAVALQRQIAVTLEALPAITERLSTIETVIAAVPDYGQAILDGVELGRRSG